MTWIAVAVGGVLGGFTTFSAFALDTLSLTQSGFRSFAAVNAIG